MKKSQLLLAILSNTLIIFLTGIVAGITVFMVTLLFFKFVISKSAFTGEGGITAVFLPIWLTILALPLSLIPAYFLSMKLSIYLREKHGWPLTHPRRLFILSVLIPVTLLLVVLAVLGRTS